MDVLIHVQHYTVWLVKIINKLIAANTINSLKMM